MSLVVGQEIGVGGGKCGEVRSILLRAPLGESRAAVQHEAHHRDQGDESKGEDDDDLTALVDSSTGRGVHQ